MGPYGSKKLKKNKNGTLPSKHFWIFWNFFWIFFSVVNTKVLFWIVDFLMFNDFFLNSPLYPMWKPNTSIIWKTSVHSAKPSEIWAPGANFQCRQLLTVKWFILGSLGEFAIFGNLVSRKWLVVVENEVKFVPRGEYSVYTGYFWQLSAWGHSVVIRCISDFR